MTRVFVDTNVLVYSVDPSEPSKRDASRRILLELARTGEIVTSTQVLKEFYNIALRKIGLASNVAERCVREFARNEVIEVSVEIILAGIALHRAYSLSFWDALIIQTAVTGDCDRLLSEDMQHDSRYEGLLVWNPF
ncbi:PIN domain-containing protein [Nitrococcus mobilis]|uniref:Ribonuclease VapC n=1 Tax=Nitrococcus mobilis Nb-231 TaxID=314278 RepID=A4BM87_9GAMM|nr:PIN domain-containing protein [Nitrococcus mobilis]EAR23425.1 PIN domain protein [Nitrococcus mobilis Nb-231]